MSRNYQNSDDFRRHENDQAHAEERMAERKHAAAMHVGFGVGIEAAVAAARASAGKLREIGQRESADGLDAFATALETSYPKPTTR